MSIVGKVTEIKTAERIIVHKQQWAIPKASSLSTKRGDYIKSPSFQVGGASWALELYPGGQPDDSTTEVRYILTLEQPTHPRLASQELCVVMNNGDQVTLDERSVSANKFSRHCTGWGSQLDMDYKELLLEYAENDTLVLQVEISVHMDEPTSTVSNYGALLETGAHADVTLVVGDTEMPAHKCILSAQSPYFQAMFAHKMSENLENRVTIHDVDVSVMKEWLSFAYTGRWPETKTPLALLVAADRFQTPDLVQLCLVRSSQGWLTNENWAECFLAADKLTASIPALMQRCLEHIRNGKRLPKIMQTQGYKQLKKAHVTKVLETLVVHRKGKRRRESDDDDDHVDAKRARVGV